MRLYLMSFNNYFASELPLPACLVKNSPSTEGSITRLYLMSYFPSGFWSRLMTRLLADESFSDILRTLFVRERDCGGGGGTSSSRSEDEESSNEILDRLAEKGMEILETLLINLMYPTYFDDVVTTLL